MAGIKKVITAGIAALALTAASLAMPTQVFAGGGHGGHGGHHGHHGGHHGGHGGFHGQGHHWQGHYQAHNGCWKWTHHGWINLCIRH